MAIRKAVEDICSIQDLKQSPQWVCWKLDPEKGKVPINPKTGGNAQSNNPATWASYEKAVQESVKYDGIGFMFANGVCGIDIDGAEGDPERTEQAQDIIRLMDTYTEYSPSGKGYHIIFRCNVDLLPKDYTDRFYQKNKTNSVECYFSGKTYRFFTYTGEAISNNDIEDRTQEALSFLERYMQKPAAPDKPTQKPPRVADNRSDEEYLNTGLAKDQKFIALWNGDRPSGNESADDQGLINKLAYWCNGNETLIYDTFFKSPHYLSKDEAHIKKCDREDYVTRTISRAINDLASTAQADNEHYNAQRNTLSTGRVHLLPDKPTTKKSGMQFINPFETPDTRQRYSWNDIGMGYLFADTYKNVSRYVPEAKSWYYYDGKVWRQDMGGMRTAQQAKDLTDYMLACAKFISDDQIKEAWVDFVGKRIKRTARETMLADAASVYPVSILEFDNDPYIFNCLNCTLDLKGFKMRAHRSDDLLSKISNVIFDKNAKCERWESFINEIMQGDSETAKFFQKALGYTLTGDTSKECFFILYGHKSRNGKGTSMETTLHLLGDYGRTAQPESIAQKQNANGSNATEDIARLKGARFVNISEPDKGLRLNSALVKQMTGGDTMTARFLHQNSFEFKPEFKLFINTNHLPKVSDNSMFNSRRIKLIPFERHFEDGEQDKGLKMFFRQPENISGIFNWFVEGFKLLNLEGLEQPEAVTIATEEYRETSDTIGLFVKERLTPCTNNYMKIEEVYAGYKGWCNENGYSAKNKANLSDELKKMGAYKRHYKLGYVMYDYMLKNQCPFDDGA